MNVFMRDKRIIVSAIFLLSLVVFLGACKKEATDTGISVQPDEDLLNATLVDTFTINTYTQLEDSLKTSDLSNVLVGSYVDPVFGKSTAEFYTQLGLSTVGTTVDLMTTTIDSVVLYVRYSKYYGDLDAQTFTVSKLTEQIVDDSTYYSNQTRTTDGVELIEPGYETIVPDFESNVVVGTDTLDPMLHIRLKNSFGNDILNLSTTGGLATESAFKSQFYGIKVGVNNPSQANGEGAILYMDLNDSQSKVIVYYTEASTAKQLALPTGSTQSRFSHFTHDYTGTAIASQLADSTLGNTFYYAQAMAGLKSIIDIKGINNLNSIGDIIINKAELYLPVQYFTTDIYTTPNNAFVFYTNDEGGISVTLDQLASSVTYGGSYDNVKKAYVFNIGRHVQRMLKGDVPNNGFVLNVSSASVSANRVILSGRNSPNRAKPYLKVYYTKY